FYLPVRNYSSGMRARLSFGLSLAFNFDYYLIDEVIAVGDARFRAKCQIALNEIQEKAGIILVSHSMPVIKSYCDQLAVIHQKKLHFFETMEAGMDFYQGLVQNGQKSTIPDFSTWTGKRA